MGCRQVEKGAADMSEWHRAVDEATSESFTADKRRAKEIVTTLIEKRAAFRVERTLEPSDADEDGWLITVLDDDNTLSGRWHD